MLNKYLKAIVAIIVLFLTLTLMGLGVLFLACIDFFSFKLLHKSVVVLINQVYKIWVKSNRLVLVDFLRIKITQLNIDNKDKWVVLTCNHQSWMDILLLQILFVDDLPPMKFFMKQSLIWVPFVGVVAKLLNYPFIKRYPKSAYIRNPKLKQHNAMVVSTACQKLMRHPTTLVNFPEGTRFSPAKHKIKSGSYKHLLPPHSKGLGKVFTAWQSIEPSLYAVTIKYNYAKPSFLDWLLGKISKVDIYCHVYKFDAKWVDDGSSQYKLNLQKIINKIWQEQDNWLDSN